MLGLRKKLKQSNQELVNKNIEIINPSLYALRFSLIPFIKEIEYKPYDEIPAYQEPMRLDRSNGILLLNKDHAGYELVKDAALKAMSKRKNGQLERELLILKHKKNKDKYMIFYETALMVELERRVCQEAHSSKAVV